MTSAMNWPCAIVHRCGKRWLSVRVTDQHRRLSSVPSAAWLLRSTALAAIPRSFSSAITAVGFWRMIGDPDGGQLRAPGSGFALSRSPISEPAPPPHLGAPTHEVLAERGMSMDDIAELTDAGAVPGLCGG